MADSSDSQGSLATESEVIRCSLQILSGLYVCECEQLARFHILGPIVIQIFLCPKI